MTTLRISDDLKLPAGVVTEKLAFLGRTGSGKTYAAQKLAEELHAVGAQFVVLDPVGVWYGLRLAADGKKPGLPIPVLGGLRGDIPLEPTGGALIANLVVDRATSVVLDVSQFESDAAKARFAQDFADRFFFRKKAAPSAVHIFIEECQEFMPQNPQREEARMLHAFTRLVKIGRNFGIGVSMLSQRPQEVNKKVLNLAELLFAFQLTGPQERKTIQGWIADKGLDEDIAGELPKLAVGHPHVWSPAWLKVSKVIAISEKWTFDASSTPVLGKAAAARELSPIDLEHLRKEMAATIEKAKAEDPRELRAEIARLRAELKKKVPAGPVIKPPKRVEVPIFKDATVKRFDAAVARLEVLGGRLDAIGAATLKTAADLRDELKTTSGWVSRGASGTGAIPPKPIPPKPMVSAGISRRPRPDAGDGDLDKCERAILGVLSQHHEGCTKGTLALLAGYRWSGGFRNALSSLRTKGLIVGPNTGVMEITAAGEATGPYEALPVGQELVDYWLTHPSLGICERKVLAALVEAYPKGLEAEALATSSGYEWSGGFRNALSNLRTAGVLVGRNTERMTASAALFG